MREGGDGDGECAGDSFIIGGSGADANADADAGEGGMFSAIQFGQDREPDTMV